ncbi:hypothetical protein A9Q99_27270 [Gammaproteobacteria bacterium 45_16_T64]|nr:hypothetical protein A9Q99_27270 [Gammaproteobacteria bacterium 45_16_T64]
MDALKRSIIVLPAAVLVTLVLLLVMATLIKTSNDDLLSEKRVVLPNILMPDVQIETRRLIEKPEKPEVLPEPNQPKPENNTDAQETDLAIDIPAPDLTNSAMDLTIGLGLQASDGEYLPIFKVAPAYPSRAARRGIEGYVVLEYIVTTSGTVRDIVVIDAKPSNTFNLAAKRSARGYKYQPRIVDGNPVEVSGVRTKIVFKMEK